MPGSCPTSCTRPNYRPRPPQTKPEAGPGARIAQQSGPGPGPVLVCSGCHKRPWPVLAAAKVKRLIACQVPLSRSIMLTIHKYSPPPAKSNSISAAAACVGPAIVVIRRKEKLLVKLYLLQLAPHHLQSPGSSHAAASSCPFRGAPPTDSIGTELY